jgi:hypothetical protein
LGNIILNRVLYLLHIVKKEKIIALNVIHYQNYVINVKKIYTFQMKMEDVKKLINVL